MTRMTVNTHAQAKVCSVNKITLGVRGYKASLPASLISRRQRLSSVRGASQVVTARLPASYAGIPAYAQAAPVAEVEAPTTTGRRIVFAVDGTIEAEEGLRWVVKQLAKKGDTVHLVHVLSDSRTPSTAVGSSAAATQWSPARDEQVYAREFFLRMEHEAQNTMSSRFIPTMQFTGVNHEVDLLRMRLHKSAAAIGEAICNRAQDISADMVVIASHGAGVLAEYGSVARWCMDNSRTPVLLVPPPILKKTANQQSNSIIVAATDNLHGLRYSFNFAMRHLVRPGDNVYVLHVQLPRTEEEAVAARKQLVSDVLRWQAESPEVIAPTINIACDLVTENNTNQSLDEANAAGSALCQYAADLNARAMVLHHHGKGMMREMMFSPVTVQVTKNCCSPLVVLGAVGNGSGSDSPSLTSM